MIELIPAIDIIAGQCVRLTHGDFARKTVYAEDPVELAKRFESTGLRRLHIVDLDGAKRGSPANIPTLERVASNTGLKIDFGGGIKTEADVANVLDAGAAIVNVGSIAVKDPSTFLTWIDRFGGDRILLGADCRDGKIAVNGWQEQTNLPISLLLSNYVSKGIRSAFVTDIGRDGAMTGPSLELYKKIISDLPELELIASGGVSSIRDVEELQHIGCRGVIVGKAIYEGRISDEEMSRYAG
jgi:phosphoribosylformimino-5-aminoimidazole carboxamide ribotide isomerase